MAILLYGPVSERQMGLHGDQGAKNGSIMAGTLTSQFYSFDRHLSENNLCQTWAGRRLDGDVPCLLKTTVDDSSVDQEQAKSLLVESYRMQIALRSHRVITACRRRTERGRLIIEYPWLDPDVWTELTPALFWKHLDAVFPQICRITDYLHTMGYVHCDLKLSNFLIKKTGEIPEMVMIDMDFLSRAKTSPKGKILGTREHVAPEITENDRIVVQSDNYSLGVSLEHYLAESGCLVSDQRRKAVEVLIEDLIQTDYLRRPRSLVSTLDRFSPESPTVVYEEQKTVLAMALLSRYRFAAKEDLETAKGLTKFLRTTNLIMGLRDEMIKGLAAVLARDLKTGFRVFKKLVGIAIVSREADYWRLSFSDDETLAVYSLLDEATGMSQLSSESSLEETLTFVRNLKEQNRPEQAYLTLKSDSERLIDKYGAECEEIVLRELSRLARSINRFTEVDDHLSRLLEIRQAAGADCAELLAELVETNITLERLDPVQELLDICRRKGYLERTDKIGLDLCRNLAWTYKFAGQPDVAIKTYERAIREASGREYYDLATRAKHNMASAYWKAGNMTEAERLLHECLDEAEEHGMPDRAVHAYCLLSKLYFNFADYEQSVKYGKLGVKLCTRDEHLLFLTFQQEVLTDACTRLADYAKAEFWYQKNLDLRLSASNRIDLMSSASGHGFLRLNQGMTDEARESFSVALELGQIAGAAWSRAVIRNNLAEVALLAGRSVECERQVDAGREESESAGGLTGLAEINLVARLNEATTRNLWGKPVSGELTAGLLKLRCRYYAVRSFFYDLLFSGQIPRELVAQQGEPIRAVIRQAGPPLFDATTVLLDFVDQHSESEQIPAVIWKKAFTVLLNAEFKFPAMLVARKLAWLYKEASQSTVARKFLQQALRLAEALDNRTQAGLIKKDFEKLVTRTEDHSRLIESFRGVSEILRDIGDYRGSMRSLVQFAVEQTGAERGVLLLKARDTSDLRVVASVNCDDDSLVDIQDFSSSIPKMSLAELSPMIVDDAVSDKRTKDYKSIVYHNIMSVVCVPLTDGEESLGALYLDHHTIPALFSRADISYIDSIANFISIALTAAQDHRTTGLKNLQLQYELAETGRTGAFITRDPVMADLLGKLSRAARSNAPVLLLGESGTGKEILSQQIHDQSLRNDMPLVKLNCAAIAETLVESELFGIADKTATGVRERDGKFSLADGGTLCLDEIGEMSLNAQAKILRAIDNQAFERVGSNRTVHTDIRFVFATNRNLRQMVKNRTFREDLYYRISTIEIEIPPLRKHPGDIPLLIEHFVQIFCAASERPRFSSDALDALTRYCWPGNVRQLKNFVERCKILYAGKTIKADLLPPEIQQSARAAGDQSAADAAEAARIRDALEETGWNQSAAARKLGMSLATFRRRIDKYGIRKSS